MPFTPSLNNTVVLAGSGGQITDAAGNVWSISPSNTVLENGVVAGFSANVTKLAYVGGVIYQQNKTDAWYNWNGTTWLGIVHNPLPAPVPPASAGSPPGGSPATRPGALR
jgi:hypothetical protein